MAVPERPVLVAPDSFKGTFNAAQVAGAIGRGLERAGLMPPDLCPVADGGEGTLDALLPQLGGELSRASRCAGPLGEPVRTGFGLVEDGGTAIVEMAMASGLGLVPEDERDAWNASTYGTGELIAAAAQAGRGRDPRRGRRLGDDATAARARSRRSRRPAASAAPRSSCCATCARRSRTRRRSSGRRRAPTRR